MPAFEWVHVQLHQQKGMISLSPPTICNSARLIYLQIFVHILHKQERFVAGLYSGHLLIPLHSQSAR
ncbi:hypothetical protein AKN40_2523 [Escherichia coli]|nr:hypothetical protein AKN40_2523 [Escherichia coli]